MSNSLYSQLNERIPNTTAYNGFQGLPVDPEYPFSTDNYRSLTVDNICRDPGCERLGIRPVSLRAVGPRYLAR